MAWLLYLICLATPLLPQPSDSDSLKEAESVRQLEEVVITRDRSLGFVEAQGARLVVDMQSVKQMPKFLGTSDPIRYVQSLAGISTNNELRTGIHIQGCDDYQSLVAINGAPVFYPNHLMGLYSTFIGQHFKSMVVEQSEHGTTMSNRVGGYVDLQTHHEQPERFGFEGNIGIINSDITFTIPCGKQHALWLSARSSYSDLLFSKWLKTDLMSMGYHFMDFNATYAYHPTDKDELIITGFYSRDKLGLEASATDLALNWQNVLGSARYRHSWSSGSLQSDAFFSAFRSEIKGVTAFANLNTQATFASVSLTNRVHQSLTEHLAIEAGLDYRHYFCQPISMREEGLNSHQNIQPGYTNAEEIELSAGIRHTPVIWFEYEAGIHGSAYYNGQWFGGVDPRLTFHFYPAKGQEIALHGGTYRQHFHKAALFNGGLPTDFMLMVDKELPSEYAYAANLRYSGSFLDGKLVVQAEGYFKQLRNVVESTGYIMELLNQDFDYRRYLMVGDGRNYGLSILIQKPKGIFTGYITYGLAWARRKIPELEGYTDYHYAASHDRRHDLNIVANVRFAKRWSVGAHFVLASGLPYTRALEAYVINRKMVCRYDTFNGATMKIYHRLDISISCDIIKKKGHELGINLSAYNVYLNKNQQFVVYRNSLRPDFGTTISTIIPSLSIYGKF